MGRTLRNLSPEYPIHVTARSNNKEHFPTEIAETWTILEDHLFLLNKLFKIQILSFVLMPNHFHLIVKDPELALPAAMNYFMRETSREIGRKSNRINRIWGAKYHTAVIDSIDYYFTCYRYVYRNPVEAGLCGSVLNYRFSTLAVLLGQISSVIPLEEDFTLFGSVEQTIKWLDQPVESLELEIIRKSIKKKLMRFSSVRSSRQTFRPALPKFLTQLRNQF